MEPLKSPTFFTYRIWSIAIFEKANNAIQTNHLSSTLFSLITFTYVSNYMNFQQPENPMVMILLRCIEYCFDKHFKADTFFIFFKNCMLLLCYLLIYLMRFYGKSAFSEVEHLMFIIEKSIRHVWSSKVFHNKKTKSQLAHYIFVLCVFFIHFVLEIPFVV